MSRRLSWMLAVAFLAVPVLARAAQKPARGITVGPPRAFDNRALTLMLESLNQSLAGLNVIDQKALAQGLGRFQGSQLTEVTRDFVLQGAPTPQVQTVAGLTGGGSTTQTGSSTTTAAPAGTTTVAQAGTTATSQTGTTLTETKTQPSLTPTPPSGSAVPSPPSAFGSLQYSLSASDLLSEQVNLTYQIFNIRMLLDRALGDRLLWDQQSGLGTSRVQAVLGTNVWLDPPRDAVNAAAVVEITVELPKEQCPDKECKDQRLGVVAMMPQERTYNTAALSSKANAFGGAAAVNMFSVGYTERRRGQTFYLYRENDTVAFEKQADAPNKEAEARNKQADAPNKVTFGWVFRPVLGRRSVMAGARQMFAVLSLPVADANAGRVTLKAAVKAYWRKFDPDTLTTVQDKIRPWAKVGHVLSLGTSLNRAPKGKTEAYGYLIDVPLTKSLGDYLKPEIKNVVWRPAGTKLAIVGVQGSNLFHDTRVALGDRVLATPADGLRLVSDQAFDVTTSITSLSADAAVLGRYAAARPLEVRVDKPRLVEFGARWNEALGGAVEATLLPRFDSEEMSAGCLCLDDMADDRLGLPIVFLNGVAVDGPYQYPPHSNKDMAKLGCVTIVARVPESMAKQLAGVLTLKFPFRGAAFQASQRVYDPRTAIKPRILAANDYLFERLDGSFGAANTWRVLVPGEPPVLLADNCDGSDIFCLPTSEDFFVRFRPTKAVQGNVLLQWRPKKPADAAWASTYVIALPAGPQDPPPPTVETGQLASVDQNDAVWRTFRGSGLKTARALLGDTTGLRTRNPDDGKTIEVLLSTEITKVPRTIDIDIVEANGNRIGRVQVVVKPVQGKETSK